MGESLAELKKPQREVLKAAGDLSKGHCPKGGDFTRRELREVTGIPHTRLREIIADLVSLEYLIPIDGGPGKSFLYRLGELPPDGHGPKGGGTLAGLTTPEQLKEKMDRGELPS